MSAVFRLMRTYFTATPLMRGLSGLGLVGLVAGIASLLYAPNWALGTGSRPEALWLQSILLFLPWLAVLALFAATALMPLMLERLALGRLIYVLPGGRLRLLASAVLTTAAVALITAGLATLAFRGYPIEMDYSQVFVKTFAMAFVNFGFIYCALWAVSKTSGIWRLMGTLLIVVAIVVPLGYIGAPGRPLGWPVYAGLSGWVVFSAILLSGARLVHALHRLRARLAARAARLLPQTRYAGGTETALLLGTGRPWVVALGQLVPIGVAAAFISIGAVWLFFLALFSAISGAITSFAAARSRRLWLRYDWSRAEIFRHVEAAYWRYNGYSLGVLLLAFVVVGSWFDFSTPVMALGVPLLILGAVVSTYLGLMMTRGLGWLEASLAIVTTTLLMATALVVSNEDPAMALAIDTMTRTADQGLSSALAIELEVLLGALAVLYRFIARSRWHAIDWMLCRSDAATANAR